MMQDSWEGMDKALRQLLGQVKKHLSPSEQHEIADYIEENELEAALEAMVDVLVEKKVSLTKGPLDAARKIASTMELDSELARINKKLA